MKSTNSFELFSKNPNIDTDFPLLFLDVNNRICIPKRTRFHEIHWHDDLQITYVLKGEIKVQSLQETIVVKENEAIFINKRILHKITDSEETHYCSFIFPDNFIKFYDGSAMNEQINSIIENHQIEFFFINQPEITNLIKNLDELISSKSEYKEYTICSGLLQIMSILLNVIPKPDNNRIMDKHQNLCVQNCLAFIHKHYNEDISLEDIAHYGNISAGHCGRLFRTILETSPFEYLVDYRIKKSLDLLSSSQYNISDIAMQTGFNSVSYYIQCFKKRLDITPKQYREQLFRTNNM